MRGIDELDQNTPSVCLLSKGCNSNISGEVWCVKLKPTGLVVRDFELTKRKYLHSIFKKVTMQYLNIYPGAILMVIYGSFMLGRLFDFISAHSWLNRAL